MRAPARRWGGRAWAGLLSCFVALVLALPVARALDVPELGARVNDHAGLLTPSGRQALESKLASYEQATGHQFSLLTVPTLDGDPIEDFSIRVVEKWKLGDKKRDDGLVMIIAVNDRKMRIEVGYGLEGEVTDAFSSQVLRDVMQPAFRAGAYAAGIDRAFDLLMAKAQGIAVGVPRQAPAQRASKGVPGFVIMLIIVFVLYSMFGGGGGGGRRRRGGVLFLPGGFGGGGGGGGFFGGGGGGGGGGGFGGGGGGGFGGGGASGDW